ncbi:MAG: hypothetical protein HXS46_11315 [Theionarchaea archaeon]|nr:MAG: hypothetical protein AYK18_01905 [Theionarchaea archaeon DG-70]MBU7011270.1 hypothetical protein [Theionarchaea archaeon]
MQGVEDYEKRSITKVNVDAYSTGQLLCEPCYALTAIKVINICCLEYCMKIRKKGRNTKSIFVILFILLILGNCIDKLLRMIQNFIGGLPQKAITSPLESL